MHDATHLAALRLLPNPLPFIRIARETVVITRCVLAEQVLNSAFRDSLASGALDDLEGRCLQITVTDIGICLGISCARRTLIVDRSKTLPDVTFKGELQDFLLLATRRVDPDTLFFQRRLKISGDTALGLVCKNAMDAIDLDVWPRALQRLLALVGELVDNSGNQPKAHRHYTAHPRPYTRCRGPVDPEQ